MTGNSGETPAQVSTTPSVDTASNEKMDPVRRWTLISAALIVLLIIWYLAAGRLTPFTSQARVNAYVVPVAPEVSGKIKAVDVGNNQFVEKGARLFQIDPTRYELAVAKAEADLEAAGQQVGALTAAVDSAAANVAATKASLLRSQKDADRLERIYSEDPGAISDRRLTMAQASLAEARSRVAGAEAELQRAREQLGKLDEQNATLLAARANLEQARLDLQRTTVVAPERGLVTDVRVDVGNFAQPGQPLMIFVAIHDVWIVADFTENNLGHLKVGDPVDFVLDVRPGKVFQGTVRSIGYGVAVNNAALGQLPTVENDRNWLRDAQRFPVIIDLREALAEARLGLRVGSQVDVIAYTGDSWILNTLGAFYIRLISLFSYAY